MHAAIIEVLWKVNVTCKGQKELLGEGDLKASQGGTFGNQKGLCVQYYCSFSGFVRIYVFTLNFDPYW